MAGTTTTTEPNGSDLATIRETIAFLRTPVSDISDLLTLLAPPLEAIGLLPPAFLRYCRNSIPTNNASLILKNISMIQVSLLENIAPAWESTLKDQKMESILYQYFCPDSFFSELQSSGRVALSAYDSVLSSPMHNFSVDVLCKLTQNYPIDRLHSVIFSKSSSIPIHRRQATWESLSRNFISIPSKVMNYQETGDVRTELQPHKFYALLCLRFWTLLSTFDRQPDAKIMSSLTHLLTKMVNIGLFPSQPHLQSSQTSFFATVLPSLRTQLAGGPRRSENDIWTGLWASLTPNLLSKVLVSLFANLVDLPDDFDTLPHSRGLIKRKGQFLTRLIGNLEGEEDDKWQAVAAALLARSSNITKARILVCWAIISEENTIPPRSLETLLSKVMDIWTSSEHINYSLLSHHQYLTALLLLCFSSFPASAHALEALALSPAFISAISIYISHLDPTVRRCGMLAAEIVAQRTGKTLDFAQWDGVGQGREWARKIRSLIEHRDVDAEEAAFDIIRFETDAADEESSAVGAGEALTSAKAKGHRSVQVKDANYDSDDSLTGYASSPASSRSPSPTLSELEEVEKDPTIRLGRKKVQKPVYLADLGNMLRSGAKPDDAEQADRIEVALNCAEELIRKKKGFGLELEENAVNLVYALVGLQNNFELDGFDKKRQGAVNALVACCPQRASPAIIDEFFKNQYSTAQRFVILNALALGARELASLPIPSSDVSAKRIAFPSKQLPEPLHRRLISDEMGPESAQVHRMLDDISRSAIESAKNEAETKLPQIVRDKQLRIKRSARISEVNASSANALSRKVHKDATFTDLAAEYFVGPLVGKFWLFFRDEQVREERTTYRATAYRGTGIGLILSPLVLAQFLGTVAVLMHASRHSPAYLAVLAPDTLELAVTLGTRPMSAASEDMDRQASVLTVSLELALVVLDGCLDLDGGRSLALEHTAILLGIGEWADQVLQTLESGIKVSGGGGVQEMRLRRSAAGVVLKVDELTSQWNQSMVKY